MIDAEKRLELIWKLRPLLEPIGASHEVPWIIEHLEQDKSHTIETVEKKTRELIQRRLSHEPLAYILGSWAFRNHEFFVGPGVLIPRPETEEMVEVALSSIHNSESTARAIFNGKRICVADFGSGSGCIGLSFLADLFDSLKLEGADAHELSKNFKLVLVEREAEALDYLKRNLGATKEKLLNAEVEIVESSWADYKAHEKISILLSNPPYLSAQELFECEASVKHFEPQSALVHKENPLSPHGVEAYEELLAGVEHWLDKDSWLFFEIGMNQGEWILEKARSLPYLRDIRVHKDMAKKPRIFSARK